MDTNNTFKVGDAVAWVSRRKAPPVLSKGIVTEVDEEWMRVAVTHEYGRADRVFERPRLQIAHHSLLAHTTIDEEVQTMARRFRVVAYTGRTDYTMTVEASNAAHAWTVAEKTWAGRGFAPSGGFDSAHVEPLEGVR